MLETHGIECFIRGQHLLGAVGGLPVQECWQSFFSSKVTFHGSHPNTSGRLRRNFAKLVVVRDDVDKLVEVMIWVENNSYWEEQMPEDSRLPKLPVTVSTQRARKLAGEVRPNAKPAMPLPVSSQQWLEDLQISIEKMS